jgi:MFS family permease
MTRPIEFARSLPQSVCVPKRRAGIVAIMGLIQIFAWGSSYYLLAVLAKPIAAGTGWPLTSVIAGLSLGLLVAGFVSPTIGRAIQKWGGRPILAGGSVFFAVGLVGLGVARNIISYFVAWTVLGVGMASGLYDAAFATLGRLYGASARGTITALTLVAGFSSTICWPLSAILVETFGWRKTCLAYAVLHILVGLPAYLLFLPKAPSVSFNEQPQLAKDRAAYKTLTSQQLGLFAIVATTFTLGAAVSSVMSVHLLTILQARGLSLSAAVWFGTLVGPSQIGARLYEVAIGHRFHPTMTFLTSGFLITIGIAFLLLARPAAALGIVLYGGGAGVMTIARGTLPLVLFHPSGYATMIGRLAFPTLVAQAIAPAAAAALLEGIDGASRILTILIALAVFNLMLIWMLRICSTDSTDNAVAG